MRDEEWKATLGPLHKLGAPGLDFETWETKTLRPDSIPRL